MIQLLAALTGSRKLMAVLAVVAVLAACGFLGSKISGWRADAKRLPEVELELKAAEAAIANFRQAVEIANQKVADQERVDEAKSRELADTKARLEAADRKVSRYWGRIKALEETTDETTGCRVISISTGYGVCFSAAAAGVAADVAACETAGGDGPAPPG